MQSLAEQISRERIFAVVDHFYSRIQTHPTLAEPFRNVQDWPHHKDRLTYFWWVVLGGARTRDEQYDPVPKHFAAGFSPALLQDWLALFADTVTEDVPAPLAAGWVEVAHKIGAGLVHANAAYAVRAISGRPTP